MQQRMVWTLIGAGLVGLLIGAGGMALLNNNNAKNNASSTTPTPTPSTATATVRPTTSVTPIPHVSTNPTAACTTPNLNISFNDTAGGGAAGSMYYNLTFVNKGSQACALMGYPGVSMVDTSGSQVGQPAERATDKPTATITLQPKASVNATVRVVNNNYGPGVCKEGAVSLKVYPPNQTESVIVPAKVSTWCPGFSVTAVFGGS